MKLGDQRPRLYDLTDVWWPLSWRDPGHNPHGTRTDRRAAP
jgi:hypothetical protein